MRVAARAGGDGDVLIQSARQQIRIAVIGPPFVGHSVNRPGLLSHEQPCLQPFSLSGDLVHRQLEMFDEDGSIGKAPLADGQETICSALA